MKKLPLELKDYIYDIAGPFSKYLRRRIDLSPTVNKRLIRRDAIQMGWRGDYSDMFEFKKHDCVLEIADIVINQSKDFHNWLVDHLRSNEKTRNVAYKVQRLKWETWWKDSIDVCDSDYLRHDFDSAIRFSHVEMVRHIMTSDERKMKMLKDPGEDDRYFVNRFFCESYMFASSSEYVFEKTAQSHVIDRRFQQSIIYSLFNYLINMVVFWI